MAKKTGMDKIDKHSPGLNGSNQVTPFLGWGKSIKEKKRSSFGVPAFFHWRSVPCPKFLPFFPSFFFIHSWLHAVGSGLVLGL